MQLERVVDTLEGQSWDRQVPPEHVTAYKYLRTLAHEVTSMNKAHVRDPSAVDLPGQACSHISALSSCQPHTHAHAQTHTHAHAHARAHVLARACAHAHAPLFKSFNVIPCRPTCAYAHAHAHVHVYKPAVDAFLPSKAVSGLLQR